MICAFFWVLAWPFCSSAGAPGIFDIYNISTRDGLPSNAVNSMAKDDFGRMWFATEGGLACYNTFGTSYYSDSPASPGFFHSNSILDMAIDHERVWMVTKAGVEYFDMRTRRPGFLDHPQLYDAELQTIALTSHGNLLLGGRKGLFHYVRYDDSLTELTCADVKLVDVTDLHVDRKGTIWISTSSCGVFYREAGSAHVSRLDAVGLPEDIQPVAVRIDPQGNLLIATMMEGVYSIGTVFGGRHVASLLAGYPQGKEVTAVFGFDVDHDGNLWFTGNNGIFVMYEDAGKQHVMEGVVQANGRRIEKLDAGVSVFCDEDIVWATRDGRGVYCLKSVSGDITEMNPMDDGLAVPAVTAIFRSPSGAYYVGSNRGNIFGFDPEVSVHFRELPGITSVIKHSPDRVVAFDVSPEKGKFFAGVRSSGVYLITEDGSASPRLFAFKDVYPGSIYINDIALDYWGNLLVATRRGLLILKRKGDDYVESVSAPLNAMLANDEITAISVDADGTIWLGSRNRGVIQVKGGYETPRTYQYNVDNARIGSNSITCFLRDSSHVLWVGTVSAGVFRFDPNNDRFNRIPRCDLLPSQNISSIVSDTSGNLWISSENGFACYNLAQSGGMVIYRSPIGLVNYSFIPGSGLSENGRVFFGSFDGMCMFRPETLYGSTKLYKPLIIGIFVNSQPLFSLNQEVKMKNPTFLPPFTENLVLSRAMGTGTHGGMRLEIGFGAACYDRNVPVKFSYMLSGIDSEWVHTDEYHRSAVYSNLKSGNYVFYLRSGNDMGTWSDPIALAIKILPSPWLSWWAISLYVLFSLAIGLSYLLYSRWHRKTVRTLNDKIDELTETKMKLMAKFRDEFPVNAKGQVLSNVDNHFLERIVGVIVEHLSESDFTVDSLNREMAMSNSSLYRRLKELTGRSQKDFIQDVRFKQACALLKEKTCNVSEVAFRVGFSDPKYFSSSFKKAFGMTPTEYRKFDGS